MKTEISTLAPQTSPITSVDIKKLPSKGISYPENATISFRTYGYGEIKKISNSNMGEREAFGLVLAGINTNFDKYSITFGDFMYLSLFRKIATLGTTKFQVPYRAPISGEVRYHVMSVEELEIEDLDIPKLPIKATFHGGELIFEPLTVGNVLELISKNELRDPTSLMAAQVRNNSFDQAKSFIHSITNPDDLATIAEVERLLAHNIKPITIQCTEKDKTGREVTNNVTIRLEGRQALLLPFREEGVPSRSGISFG